MLKWKRKIFHCKERERTRETTTKQSLILGSLKKHKTQHNTFPSYNILLINYYISVFL